MKKLFFVLLCLGIVFISGCEDFITNDVTLMNNSSRTIGVNLSTSKSSPSSFHTLGNNESRTFSEMDVDDYYIHVKYNYDYYVSGKLYISSSCTFSIQADGTGFKWE